MRFRSSFDFPERGTDFLFHLIKQSGLKGFAEKRVIEVLYNTPEAIVREAAFGDEIMNMRIPFFINFLKYIHNTIMREKEQKENPTPKD
jgi:hypothetical protein